MELARGGRYDEVGAVFGRNRPAVGFSLDLKELVGAVAPQPLAAAIRAPWGVDAGLRAAIAALRAEGQTVVCALPGHEHEVDEFHCDRELVQDRHSGVDSEDSLNGKQQMNRTATAPWYPGATWSWWAPSGVTRARASWSTG